MFLDCSLISCSKTKKGIPGGRVAILAGQAENYINRSPSRDFVHIILKSEHGGLGWVSIQVGIRFLSPKPKVGPKFTNKILFLYPNCLYDSKTKPNNFRVRAGLSCTSCPSRV